jgi:hypothetical protein
MDGEDKANVEGRLGGVRIQEEGEKEVLERRKTFQNGAICPIPKLLGNGVSAMEGETYEEKRTARGDGDIFGRRFFLSYLPPPPLLELIVARHHAMKPQTQQTPIPPTLLFLQDLTNTPLPPSFPQDLTNTPLPPLPPPIDWWIVTKGEERGR